MLKERFPMGSRVLASIISVLTISASVNAQSPTSDSLLKEADLSSIIQYAIAHQPRFQQSKMDENITRLQVKSRLADWYPQLNFNYNYQHNFQVQTNIIGGNPVRLGVDNISNLQFGLSQAIFNRDVLLAKRSKGDVELQATQQIRVLT